MFWLKSLVKTEKFRQQEKWKELVENMPCLDKIKLNTSFRERYKNFHVIWQDGYHGGATAFDLVLEKQVLVCYSYINHKSTLAEPYWKADIPPNTWCVGPLYQIRFMLDHPRFLPICDIGLMEWGKDSMRFYFTESISHEFFPNEELPPQTSLVNVVQGLIELCKALEYLYERGIYLNLRLEYIVHIDGEIYIKIQSVGDVGAWYNYLDKAQPLYIAPEQAQKVNLVNTYVYHIGTILYFVLHNTYPINDYLENFPRITRYSEILKFLCKVKHPPRGTIRESLQKEYCHKSLVTLQQICLAAIEPKSKKRIASLHEIKNALEQWLKDNS